MSYSFLLEMAWKSAAISAAALLLVICLRGRSAADRGALLRVGIAMLLLLPIVSSLFPSLVVETPSPAVAPLIAPAAASTLALEAPLGAAPAAAPGTALSGADDWNDPGILFLILYLGGVLMVAGRLVAGLWTLRRWTAEARDVACPVWRDALARSLHAAGCRSDRIRLLASAHARSPLSWGWRRPVILLDSDTLRHHNDADAILAHEIAHVLRGDWPALIASRVAVALFWFNPLVWRLDREIVQHAEEAADSVAIARVEPARYAQTLLDWARESGGQLPANAMAATEPGLSRRVRALLDGRARRRSGSFWTFAAMFACAAVAAPVAALEFVPEPPEARDLPEAPPAPPAPDMVTAAIAPSAAAAAIAATAPAVPAPLAALAPLTPATPATAVAPQAAPAAPTPATMPAPAAWPAAPPARPRIATLAALAFAARHPEPHIDEKAIAAEVEASVAEGLRHARTVRIDSDRIAREAQRAVRVSLRHGAAGMAEGAREMERGADDMRRAAARLRNRDYREREIAKAAARGKRVTHEDLLEAAEGLEEGAEDMRDGAKDMREAAEEMRRGDG